MWPCMFQKHLIGTINSQKKKKIWQNRIIKEIVTSFDCKKQESIKQKWLYQVF